MANEFRKFLRRWGAHTPQKPLSARAIAQLGDKLERAEWLLNNRWDLPGADGLSETAALDEYEQGLFDRFYDALGKYERAVQARDIFAQVKAYNSKQVTRASDALPLQFGMYDTRARSEVLEALGPAFSSRRERVDAEAAAAHAKSLFVIAQARFQDDEQFERRTGIRKRPRSSARLVTDGYVTTGKYKMIDGARVPVLEKVT